MNPFFVFFFLAAFQIAVAAIGCIVVFVVTIPLGLRAARVKAIWASLFGAAGGFVGVIIVYISILAVGLAWKVVELFHLGGPAIILVDAAGWLLMAGYIAGLVGGSYMGWKIRTYKALSGINGR
ncbi:MAG: hypothetical protein JXA50_00460 [Deltaproteobacteria bacterium]|nr:hypothetical protein [Deltaproteobacteria bacterium]